MKNKVQTPDYLPEKVENLARSFLDGLNLTVEHQRKIPPKLVFNKFALHNVNASEVILADICDELPTLACLLLVRDTLQNLLIALADDAGTADKPATYSMMPLLEHTKNYLFGLAKLFVAKFPAYLPSSFRIHDGHLVLIGEAQGEDEVRNQLGAELALHRAVSEGHFHVMKMGSLSEFEQMAGPDHLSDFTVKSKTVH